MIQPLLRIALSRLPIIAGFGGVNPAGRSSFHHAFHRITQEAQSAANRESAYLALGQMMGLVQSKSGRPVDASGSPIAQGAVFERFGEQMNQGTLLRKLEKNFFDVERVAFRQKMTLEGGSEPLCILINKKSLPKQIPPGVTFEEVPGEPSKLRVSVHSGLEVFVEDIRTSSVTTGGQLPRGFNPGAGYASNSHPRGLQMTIYGASDALGSLGLDWDDLVSQVAPDQIGVYASSAMGQLDNEGVGGYMKAALLGKRPSTKQVALSFAEMPADFINAYVLGTLGHTGGILGACATFLYNLEHAAKDIASGRRRLCFVGAAEAPLVPEVYEGYRVISALAEDEQILALDRDQGIEHLRHTHACRPFGYNCGFTLAEAAEFVVLMDEELALETGAQIYGAVAGVFVNADGYKRSITAPGVGNYLALAKAATLTRAILGEKGLRQHSFISAHGTGTPQNRVTESQVFNETAKAMGIQSWPVAAIKAYFGHSIGCAAGSQINMALGSLASGILPGIFTLDEIADDVHASHLNLQQAHQVREPGGWKAALINSKGFGGNNATGVILSAATTEEMMAKKHGSEKINLWKKRREKTLEVAQTWDQATTQGETKPRYLFGEGVIQDSEVKITAKDITLPKGPTVSLDLPHPFPDMDIR